MKGKPSANSLEGLLNTYRPIDGEVYGFELWQHDRHHDPAMLELRHEHLHLSSPRKCSYGAMMLLGPELHTKRGSSALALYCMVS